MMHLTSCSLLRLAHSRTTACAVETTRVYFTQNLRCPPFSYARRSLHASASDSNPEQNVLFTASHFSRLEGKTCMVTGGSAGIGFAIAQRFIREGVGKVILVGRRRERLVDAIEQLQGPRNGIPAGDGHTESSAVRQAADREASGCTTSRERPSAANEATDTFYIPGNGQISLMVGDVGDSSFWSDEVKKVMGTVDILVNAAGVSHSALLPLAKDEHISQNIRTNLQGTIFACRAMTRQALRTQSRQDSRKREGTGKSSGETKCILNISSLHAAKGGIGASVYASTKAGVIALTRAIAAEGSLSASGATIRANVIVPGYIETQMLDEFSEGFRAKAEESVPLKRFGTPDEVADAAVFLAANQYANNCVLNLDGGLSAM